MTALTPIERAAEVVYERIDYATDPDIARAVFESIDREGLADVLQRHGHVEWDRHDAETVADAIRAWLLSEGGA